MKRLRIGDLIYCHTTGHMSGDGEVFCIKGEYYQVTGFVDSFSKYKRYTIKDSRGNDKHEFTLYALLTGSCRWFSPGPILLVEIIDKRFRFNGI